MFFFKLIVKNVFRAKLRSALTIVGLVIAIMAFGLVQTAVHAWYAGSDAASNARLVTRNSISLAFTMPAYYRDKIRAVPGVIAISISNWFGGIYREPKNFFPQFATDIPSYFSMYPEFVFDPAEYAALLRDRRGCAIGRQLAELYGFKVGDIIPIRGTIYPGNWEFTVRAIYDGRDDTTITRQLYFHYDYLNEQLRKTTPRRADQTGVFIMKIADPGAAADVARAIDGEFKNSLAETLTETEKAFQLGFVAMIETIVQVIRAVSYIVILIIMAVTANTMAMTARERLAEYATLKALGFKPGTVASLIMGEAIAIAAIGGAIGIALTEPVARAFHSFTVTVFAKFPVVPETFALQAICALAVGVVAGVAPAWQAARIKIVDGLRHVG